MQESGLIVKYTVVRTSLFSKQIKLLEKRGYNMSLLDEVIEILSSGETLPIVYKDHKLHGKDRKYRDCHITPDWVLVYEIKQDNRAYHWYRY